MGPGVADRHCDGWPKCRGGVGGGGVGASALLAARVGDWLDHLVPLAGFWPLLGFRAWGAAGTRALDLARLGFHGSVQRGLSPKTN
ncbi:hypothetical protein GCM10029964_121070 [Kibdelosporangium lantanae]